MTKRIFVLFGLLIVALAACNQQKEKTMDVAIDRSNMDFNVKPGEDFYKFVNSGWMKNNPIPDEYSRYSAFDDVAKLVEKQLKELLDKSMSKESEAGSVDQKIGDFFRSGMDTERIEKEGYKPLDFIFEKINNLESAENMAELFSFLHSSFISTPFFIFPGQDIKNSDNVIVQISQSGLGLPDRDYYLEETERAKEIREAYKTHLNNMFQLFGYNEGDAATASEIILKIETRMAQASMSRLEMRNPANTYHKMDLAGVQEICPDFGWDTYFANIGVTATDEINIRQPEYLKEFNAMLSEVSIDDWKVYLNWKVMKSFSSLLNSEIENESFDFYSKKLSGTPKMKERWKRVLGVTNFALGEAIGQMYVAEYFPPEAKERMMTLVGNLKVALKKHIQELAWMQEETKEKALEKLEGMKLKIGYPDKWIDYSELEINPEDIYAINVHKAREFYFNLQIEKIGKPVDRETWGMTPQTVNAYYSPTLNEIVFPAAILQPPYFYLDGDDAVNYGAIGVVIGHEMTHGFDDQGRKFAANGNMEDWWTEADAEKYTQKTSVLVGQYNNYFVLDSLHINGELTLGENIADLGGVTVALTALEMAVDMEDKDLVINDFTPLQRFFLSYAQVWRQNIRDEELMRRIKEDVHSPGEARVNQIVPNVPEFYKAFEISESDPLFMKEEERAVVW
jgi:putative endopeptidase